MPAALPAPDLSDDSAPQRALISFVVPFYNEGVNVEHFHEAVTGTTMKLPYDLEFIYINDGSRDDTLARLLSLHAADPRVTVLDFSRNFGHQRAITAGMDHSAGDAVVIMDADLQDPPSVALELIEKWEEGYDVAYAQRRTRKDTFFKRVTADLYYRLLERIGDIKIPRNTGDFRLMDRKVVNEVMRFREHDRYMRGIVSSVGFKQVAVPFDRDERKHGESHYPWSKMMKLAGDGILGFSTFPLQVITRIGFVVAALAILLALYIGISKIIDPSSVVPGWSFIVISVLGVGSVQIITLGIIGSYVGRIYSEAQDRPLYSLQAVHVGTAHERRYPHEKVETRTQHALPVRTVPRPADSRRAFERGRAVQRKLDPQELAAQHREEHLA